MNAELHKIEIKKILILKWGALGDMLAATSAIRAIRESFPQAEIVLLSTNLMKQILPEGTLIDTIIDHRTYGKSIFSLIRLILKIRKEKFDLAVNLRWTSDECAVITWLSGAKYRSGSGPEKLTKLYNIPVSTPKSYYHEVDRNLDIVKGLDVPVNDDLPYMPISKKDTEFGKNILQANNIHSSNLLIIHPGASNFRKAWMPDRFIAIGRKATEELNADILITWGRGEYDLAKSVAGGIGKKALLSPETKTIGELAGLISQSRLFLTNCTGPMNIAVATRKPVVALLGSSAPEDWRPYGDIHRYIKSPLILSTYTDDEVLKAMELITVDEVWKLLSSRWSELV